MPSGRFFKNPGAAVIRRARFQKPKPKATAPSLTPRLSRPSYFSLITEGSPLLSCISSGLLRCGTSWSYLAGACAESGVRCLGSVCQVCMVSGVTARVGAMRRRAFGLRPMPPMASRPFGFNPSRLRTDSATRSACGFCCVMPATIGRALTYATACCGRLRESVPSSMLALGRL